MTTIAQTIDAHRRRIMAYGALCNRARWAWNAFLQSPGSERRAALLAALDEAAREWDEMQVGMMKGGAS